MSASTTSTEQGNKKAYLNRNGGSRISFLLVFFCSIELDVEAVATVEPEGLAAAKKEKYPVVIPLQIAPRAKVSFLCGML